MEALVQEVKRNFENSFGAKPELFSQAPGRLNIIGEHTDYTGGLSLPAAIDRWTVCAWRKVPNGRIRIHAGNLGEVWETSWREIEGSIDKTWKKYVGGCLLLFRERNLSDREPSGLEVSIFGDVPLGKGVSSSAAIELALLNGLNALFDSKMSPMDMALMAQQVEHRFLKVKSGLLDQFACQFSKPGGALLIDFESRNTEDVLLGEGFSSCSWILVDSLVKRELASSKYSERVDEYHAILEILKSQGGLRLRSLKSSDVPSLFGRAPANVYGRARHIVSENERTLEAVGHLRAGRVKETGRLLTLTHASLSKDYEVSHPNLDFMVDLANGLEGVYGGRMMGGGFGGCGIFLVERSAMESVMSTIAAEYEKFSGSRTEPRAYNFVAGASAWVENVDRN